MFFAVWAGACVFFGCLGRGAGPAQTATQKKEEEEEQHRPNIKKSTRPRPFRACFFFCCLVFGSVGVLIFCCLDGGRDFFLLFGRVPFFLLFGRGRVFFCCLGGGPFFFCFLAGWRFFVLLLFGRVAFFCFFAVWAGDRNSLTYLSAWLFFKRPSNKKDQTAKKEPRVPP